jgi:hypothetical protein
MNVRLGLILVTGSWRRFLKRKQSRGGLLRRAAMQKPLGAPARSGSSEGS